MAKLHDLDRNEVKAAYRQLLVVAEARYQFAGAVEGIRRHNPDDQAEWLHSYMSKRDSAEHSFDEDDVRRTLLLLDNSDVWKLFVDFNNAYRQYIERTTEVVTEAQIPLAPSTVRIKNIDLLLADRNDLSADPDPDTRRAYQAVDRALTNLTDAMSKRIQQ